MNFLMRGENIYNIACTAIPLILRVHTSILCDSDVVTVPQIHGEKSDSDVAHM